MIHVREVDVQRHVRIVCCVVVDVPNGALGECHLIISAIERVFAGHRCTADVRAHAVVKVDVVARAVRRTRTGSSVQPVVGSARSVVPEKRFKAAVGWETVPQHITNIPLANGVRAVTERLERSGNELEPWVHAVVGVVRHVIEADTPRV